MKNNSVTEIAGLEDSLKSMRQFRRSAWSSVLLMILGVVTVIGSFIFSITRLQPLERQIAEKQTELRAVEAEFNDLADKSNVLKRANEDAQVQLDITKKEVDEALVKLQEIANKPLPPGAKIALDDSISKIRGANATVNKAEADLNTPKQSSIQEPKRSRQALINDLFSNQSSMRLGAYNGIMADYGTDPALIPELLSFARNHGDNLNGIYNTLVVLSHLNKTQLRSHAAEIEAFARDVESMGPKIKERGDKLLSRLPR